LPPVCAAAGDTAASIAAAPAIASRLEIVVMIAKAPARLVEFTNPGHRTSR
jgi:hypothetical protein